MKTAQPSGPDILFTRVSANKKLGPIPMAMAHESTCPSACPLKGKNGKEGGCYARFGNVAIHWNRLNRGAAGMPWNQFIQEIRRLPWGQMWRWAVAGDLPGLDNRIDSAALADLTQANRNKRGFGYSHKPVIGQGIAAANRNAIAAANQNGFTINLSGNSMAHADKLAALKIAPVVTIMPLGSKQTTFTPAGNKVILCPAQTRERITCDRCKLCAMPKRSTIIGFVAHGVMERKVSELALGGKRAAA